MRCCIGRDRVANNAISRRSIASGAHLFGTAHGSRERTQNCLLPLLGMMPLKFKSRAFQIPTDALFPCHRGTTVRKRVRSKRYSGPSEDSPGARVHYTKLTRVAGEDWDPRQHAEQESDLGNLSDLAMPRWNILETGTVRRYRQASLTKARE